MAFYTGFIGKNDNGMPRLATNLFAIISIAGSVILLLVGMVSALIARAKNNLVTNSFLAFAVVQSAAVIAIILSMAFIWSGVFPQAQNGCLLTNNMIKSKIGLKPDCWKGV